MKKEQEKQKKAKKKLDLTIEVEKSGGLWKSKKDIKTNTKQLDEKQKIDALYIQLQFHHIVLNSSAPESFFFQKSHSTKGKKLNSLHLTWRSIFLR